MKLTNLFVLLLTLATALTPTHSHALRGTYAFLDGPISNDSVTKTIDIIKKVKGIKTFYISSPGGDSDEGIRLGRFLRSRNIPVVVIGKCYSACANYVFLPDKQRSTAPWASIGMHGGYRSSLLQSIEHSDKVPSSLSYVSKSNIESLKTQAQEESELLEAAGVKPEIIEKSASETLLGSINLRLTNDDGTVTEFVIEQKKFTEFDLWFPTPENYGTWGISVKMLTPSQLPIKLVEKYSSFKPTSPVSNAP